MKKILNELLDRLLLVALCNLGFIFILMLIGIGFVGQYQLGLVMRGIDGATLLVCLGGLPLFTASLWMLIDKLNRV
jgi:hypothetical protein